MANGDIAHDDGLHDGGLHGDTAMFRFTGRWQELAPIVFTNLLLTIVTLGIYRFWGTTRVRHYLWSRTRLMGEPLEWTGTGRELFIGFLLVLVVIGLPFLLLQFGLQALVLRGHVMAAGILGTGLPLLIFYLVGVARFRALRYRLSRTFWRGIRGGSDDQGLGYGLSWMWRTVAGYVPLGLLIPWAMTSLWNRRWGAMSFGSEQFRATAAAGPIFRRFLLFYLAPILFVLVAIAAAALVGAQFMGVGVQSSFPAPLQIVVAAFIFVGVYLLLGIIALSYYAAFLREAIGSLSLGVVDFRFDATTGDWITLMIVDVLLVLATLGIGILFLDYRHWKFFITHLGGDGTMDPALLGQSTTRTPGQGEGLLDAFDVGAI